MGRLSRFTQLIFGSTAGASQMAKYGSLAAGSPQTYSGATITPAIVQALSNYLNGWFSGVIGANSPAEEDMNALFFLITYQLAYLMQSGVPEWDSATTYFTGNVVNSGGALYSSLQDNNLNNAVSNTAFWASVNPLPVTSEAQLTTALAGALANGGGVIQIGGSFTMSSAHTVPAGTVLVGLNGATVITIAATGSLTVADGAMIKNLWFTSALSSGNIINLSNNYSLIRECQFTVPPSSTMNCINVTGNANKMYNNIFIGVAGQTAVGINYAAGVENVDYDSVNLA